MSMTTLGRTWLLWAVAAALLASPDSASASEECCTSAGEISECWWQDARDDGVFCTDGAQCPSGVCDTSFGLGRGLCTCAGQADCERGGASPVVGVCSDMGGATDVCGPSFCNGYSVCECYGGCVPAAIQGFVEYEDFCDANGLYCCEGSYGASPLGTFIGYCSPDMSCGTCENDADCDDGNPCTVDEQCVNHQCVMGVARDCNDGSICTTDWCDPSSAAADPCLHVVIPCVDGNNCTVDACDPVTGCHFDPVDCDDTNACSADTCNAASGACEHDPLAAPAGACCDPAVGATYDDGEACTIDSCSSGFQDVHNNRPNGFVCDTETLCDSSTCQAGVCTVNVYTGIACDDVTSGINYGYDNLYPVCGAYRCEDDGTGHGACVERPSAGVQGLECVSDADDCKDRQCNVNVVANTFTCDYKLAINAACNTGAGTICDTYQCDATHTCTLISSWPPGTVSTTPETCAGQSLGAIAGATVTQDNDNACRDDDNAPIFTGRFAECSGSEASDLAFSFTDATTDNAVPATYALTHRRVTVRAQDAGAGGYSNIHDWDPLLFLESDGCGASATNQYTCNDSCQLGFNATNLSATACAGLDAVQDSAVTLGPWPLQDYPQSSAAGLVSTTGTRTNYAWVDSRTQVGISGGEFRLSVIPEAHNNNDCRNTGAYVAAPLIKDQESWKQRYQGSTTGYTNYVFGKNASNGPACWGGAARTAADPGTAFFRVDITAGSDLMGAGQVAWPRNYKIYTDPAKTGTLNSVVSFWGNGLADGNNQCNAGLGALANKCYPDTADATLKPYVPREHLIQSTDLNYRSGWLAVSNYTALARGGYELNVLRVPRPFTNMAQLIEGSVSGGCSCTAAADAPPAKFYLEGYRLDFTPTNDQEGGFMVTASAIPGGSWLVDPDIAAGVGIVIKRDVMCSGLSGSTPVCMAWGAGAGPQDIGFSMPYSSKFFTQYCVDSAGRMQLGGGSSGYACTDTYDKSLDSRKFTSTYAPSIAPAWGSLIPCWKTSANPDSWDDDPRCAAGAGGRIVTQLVRFEGTTARVVTWDGLQGFTKPVSLRTSINQSMQFQAIIRADGRITLAYKMPTALATYAGGSAALLWDKVIETGAVLTGVSGTRNQGACNVGTNAQNDAYCNTQLSNTLYQCDDSSYSFTPCWFCASVPVYTATYYCMKFVDLQKGAPGALATAQVPGAVDPVVNWQQIP